MTTNYNGKQFLKVVYNRPFPSSKKSHFQNEAKCEAIDMKMIFNYYANISHFHNKGFALSLVLKVRFFGTRKWPIPFLSHSELVNICKLGQSLPVYLGFTLRIVGELLYAFSP